MNLNILICVYIHGHSFTTKFKKLFPCLRKIRILVVIFAEFSVWFRNRQNCYPKFRPTHLIYKILFNMLFLIHFLARLCLACVDFSHRLRRTFLIFLYASFLWKYSDPGFFILNSCNLDSGEMGFNYTRSGTVNKLECDQLIALNKIRHRTFD